MRAAIVGILVIGAVLLGVSVALAGWEWNAQLNIEGVDTHTKWTVNGGADPNAYRAQIRVWVPRGADAVVVSQMTPNENVVILHDEHLSCRADGVEVRAQYRIIPVRGADGTSATVTLVANGNTVDSETGGLNQKIVVGGLLPTGSASCPVEHED